MRIVEPGFEFFDKINGDEILKSIERAGRICYKSEDRITDTSAADFASRIIRSGHESVMEHEKISVKITCDRGVSHELVRHRIASYSQESTRYCNYSHNKFGGELTFIAPSFWKDDADRYAVWLGTMRVIEDTYNELIKGGAKPEEARCVLPNSIKTELVVTMNLREWRHFFKLRTAPAAHPQMRELTVPLLREMKRKLPAIFEDINSD